MGMIDEAMKRQWTPSAQLAMESMKGASQVAANMDKKQTTTYKSASGGGALGGFGGMLGTVAGGVIGSIVPGIGTSIGMMAGGALGGAVDNGAAGALQGFGTGMMGAKIPGMFDAGSWGELLGGKLAPLPSGMEGAGVTPGAFTSNAISNSMGVIGGSVPGAENKYNLFSMNHPGTVNPNILSPSGWGF